MLLVLVAGIAARAQVIDRVLAVVDSSIITLSDTLAALRLGLITVPPSSNPIVPAVDALIERQLMLAEVDRYVIPPASGAEIDKKAAAAQIDAEIDKKIDGVRGRLGSAEAVDRVLRESGWTPEQLRRQIGDTLRVEAYLQQRFGSVFQQPTEDDLIGYYQAHRDQYASGGEIRPFAEVRDTVRGAVMAARRTSQIQEWVETLRRRATISILVSVP
jgi:hypothetical protein